jgi:dihydrofolate synthase/folylpolyglutamate synthase
MQRVAEQLSKMEYNRLFCVLGFCEDKDIAQILKLMPKDAHYIFTRAASRRAASLEQLAEVATACGLEFECAESVQSAVETAKSQISSDDMLYIGGSTFVVAEALE